jgi:hypothetical protein
MRLIWVSFSVLLVVSGRLRHNTLHAKMGSKRLPFLWYLTTLCFLIASSTLARADKAQSQCQWAGDACYLDHEAFADLLRDGETLYKDLAGMQRDTAQCMVTSQAATNTSTNGQVCAPSAEACEPYVGVFTTDNSTAAGTAACSSGADGSASEVQGVPRTLKSGSSRSLSSDGLVSMDFCVSMSTPANILRMLLSDCTSGLPAKLEGCWGVNSSALATMTPVQTAGRLWWNFGCEGLREAVGAALAEDRTWRANRKYRAPDITQALSHVWVAQQECLNRTSRVDCERPVPDQLTPYFPALNTSCSDRVLTGYARCCDRDRAMQANRNLNGTLPDTFMPPRQLLDFTNNPALCGIIDKLHENRTSNFTMRLFNSNVKLDLAALNKQDITIGPRVVYWLGLGLVAHNNLHNMLPVQQAYHVCTLLDDGRLKVTSANYGKGQVGLGFRSQEDWDARHTLLLQLEFDSALQQARALANYNKYVEALDVGLACGSAGASYRKRVAAVSWGASSAVFVVLGFVKFLLLRAGSTVKPDTYPGQSNPPRWDRLVRYGLGLLFIAMHFYDVYSDWQLIFALAQNGNVTAVQHLGWLFASTHIFVVFVSPCLLAVQMRGAQVDMRETCVCCAAPIVAVVYTAIACGVVGAGSAAVARFGGGANVLLGDAEALARAFLGVSVPGMLLMFVPSISARFTHYTTHAKKEKYRLHEVLLVDVLYMVMEDIPQAALQGSMYVKGTAVVPTPVFIQSVVGSAAGIFLGLFTALATGANMA